MFDDLESTGSNFIASLFRYAVDEDFNFSVAAGVPVIGGMIIVESRLIAKGDFANLVV